MITLLNFTVQLNLMRYSDDITAKQICLQYGNLAGLHIFKIAQSLIAQLFNNKVFPFLRGYRTHDAVLSDKFIDTALSKTLELRFQIGQVQEPATIGHSLCTPVLPLKFCNLFIGKIAVNIIKISVADLFVQPVNCKLGIDKAALVRENCTVVLRSTFAEPGSLADIEICHGGPCVRHLVQQCVEPPLGIRRCC